MGFMSDVLQHGHRFRTFNVVDDFNREVLGIDINSGITAKRATRYLDQIAAWRGYPERIRCDNGPEFISTVLADWAEKHQIMIDSAALIKTALSNDLIGLTEKMFWIYIYLPTWMKSGKEPMIGYNYITTNVHTMDLTT